KKPAEKEKTKKKKEKDPADAFRLSPDHPVANAWKTFGGVGLIGVAGAAYGYTQDPTRFAYAWLFGFMCALTLVIGSLLFVMPHGLPRGGPGMGNPRGPGGNPHGPGGLPRGTDVRGGGGGAPPIHLQVGHPAEERAERAEHEEVMKDKTWFLSQTFFFVRFFL